MSPKIYEYPGKMEGSRKIICMKKDIIYLKQADSDHSRKMTDDSYGLTSLVYDGAGIFDLRF